MHLSISKRCLGFTLVGFFCLTVAIAFLTPLEQTLGVNLRLVYLHGAWVWAGIVTFSAAGIVGLAAVLFRKTAVHAWSRSLGWTGLCFWITSLPMSLAVMQINWNGFFFDEPRWKIPFTFAIISILLQAGLLLMNTLWITSLANLFFGSALLFNLVRMDSVLHPTSPVFTSGSAGIKLIFILLFASTLMMGAVLTAFWMISFREKAPAIAREG